MAWVGDLHGWLYIYVQYCEFVMAVEVGCIKHTYGLMVNMLVMSFGEEI